MRTSQEAVAKQQPDKLAIINAIWTDKRRQLSQSRRETRAPAAPAASSLLTSSARRMNVQHAALSPHARTSTLSSAPRRGAAAPSISTTSPAAAWLRFLFAARARGGIAAAALGVDAACWRLGAAVGDLSAADNAGETAEVSSGLAAVLPAECLAARKASAALRFALFTVWTDRAAGSDPGGPSATTVGSGERRYGVEAGDSLSDRALSDRALAGCCARRCAGAGRSLQLDAAHCA